MERRVAVAASGGRDSTALLHCTVRQGRSLGIEVVALHVQHGLVEGSGRWAMQVRAQCRRWGAHFLSTTLATRPQRGESVEAWARRERYRALVQMAQQARCEVVLLAHHRRDQAETWLLQALRGAGDDGLAAMPVRAIRDGVAWCRPWLYQPGEAIDAYVSRHRLAFVDDPSNADVRLARNRLRHTAWSALAAAFPDLEVTLGAAARKAQDGADLAREAAAMDLDGVTEDDALHLAKWSALPPARRRNALRFWLAQRLGRSPPESLLRRLCEELPRCGAAQWPTPGGVVQLYRGRLCAGTAPQADSPACGAAEPAALDLSRPGCVAVPAWRGHFECRAVDCGGVAVTRLRAARVRGRKGADRFTLAPRAAERSLKKQFQARAVPAWQREGPLLVDAQEQVIFVPGLGLNATALAEAGEPQMQLRWVPDAADRSWRSRGGG